MHFLSFLLIFFCSLYTFAQDPFDKQKRLKTTEITPHKQSIQISTSCLNAPQALFQDSHFSQLQVVGVIQNKAEIQILIAKDKQVQFAKSGDFIAQEHWRIGQVKNNQFELQHWNQQSCTLEDTQHWQNF